jgi:formate hydrogenlyase transcriptional activator
LRDRRDDIPLLVTFFLTALAKRLGKPLEGFTAASLQRLRAYDWPGNVRELQNVIERAVVATPGRTLQMPNADRRAHRPAPSARTLAQVERDHIMATLEAANWVLGGWDGAAARLGLSRTTLISRMQRLGISGGAGLHKSARQPEFSGIAKRARAQPQVAGS